MTVFLGKLTRREFRSRMNSGELKACFIPVAAIEQHLEHLAMEHELAKCEHGGGSCRHPMCSKRLSRAGCYGWSQRTPYETSWNPDVAAGNIPVGSQ